MSEESPSTEDVGASAAKGRKATKRVEPATRSAGQKLRGALTELVIVVVGALVISALLRAFVGQMFIIPSGSMESTLEINDRVVVSKVTDYQRGDIVVFEDPAQWLTDPPEQRSGVGKLLEKVGVLPSTATSHLVKRAVGLPGDRVTCCDAEGRMSVNGVALDESSYLHIDDETQAKPSNFDFDVVVPADHLFVMGDNRDHSGDSRCHLRDMSNDGQPIGSAAFVPTDKVVGPVVAIASPFDRWRRFTTPVVWAAVPAPQSVPDKASVSVTDPDC